MEVCGSHGSTFCQAQGSPSNPLRCGSIDCLTCSTRAFSQYLQTKTGRALAQGRHDAMVAFLDQMFAEVAGER